MAANSSRLVWGSVGHANRSPVAHGLSKFLPRNLAFRDLRPELIDQPDLAVDRHRDALVGLARANILSGAGRSLWKRIRREQTAHGSASRLSVCDIATGSGDVPIGLCRLANREGVKLELTGYDISPVAIEAAQARAQAANVAATFVARDVLAGPLETLGRYDVVTCSLFLHHLTEDRAVELLKRMAHMARRLMIVSDLRRCRLGYTTTQAVVRLISRCDVVHHDGPQSVAASFTMEEARALARRAGLTSATVCRAWPFRYLLCCEFSD